MTRRRVNITIREEEYEDVCRRAGEMGFPSASSFAAAALRGVLDGLRAPEEPARPGIGEEVAGMFEEYSEAERYGKRR